MSRKQAFDSLSMEDYRKSMEGIYSSFINRGTIDESPMAYKPMGEIIKNIEAAVKVLKIIKPVYNFKASE
jgi:RNA-splicing ligase RtcB